MKISCYIFLVILLFLNSCREDIPETYAVAFVDIDYNSLGLVQMVEDGESPVRPNDPVGMTDASFEGWFNDDASVFDFEAPVHKDLFVIGVFLYETSPVIVETHLVIYDYGYDDKRDTVEVSDGASLEEIMPEREDYVFDRWLNDNLYFSFYTPIYEDVTLTAKWNPLFEYRKNTNSYLSPEPNGIVITAHNEVNPTHITIPEFIDGYPVVYIETEAFFPHGSGMRNTSLISLDASEVSFMTRFPAYAFQGCENLETVLLNDSITEIEYHAFYACTSLKSITFPANVTKIHNGAFSKSGLEHVVFNDNMEELYQDAFRNCTALKSVVFPEKLWLISTGCFMGCNSLENITFTGATTIEQNVFDDCTSISTVTLDVQGERQVSMYCQACPEEYLPDDFNSFKNTPLVDGTMSATVFYPAGSAYPESYGWNNLKVNWEIISSPLD